MRVPSPILLVLVGCQFGPDPVRSGAPDAPTVEDAVVASGDVPGGDAAVPDAAPADALVADADPCAAAGTLTCGTPTGTFVCNGHCWIGCPEMYTYSEVTSRCDAWGGVVARFDDRTERDCVRASFVPTGAMWLGLTQASTATALDEGWSWNGDGAPTAWSGWTGGQPNDGDGVEDGTEQCAYQSNPSLTWQDAPCSEAFSGFACRL